MKCYAAGQTVGLLSSFGLQWCGGYVWVAVCFGECRLLSGSCSDIMSRDETHQASLLVRV